MKSEILIFILAATGVAAAAAQNAPDCSPGTANEFVHCWDDVVDAISPTINCGEFSTAFGCIREIQQRCKAQFERTVNFTETVGADVLSYCTGNNRNASKRNTENSRCPRDYLQRLNDCGQDLNSGLLNPDSDCFELHDSLQCVTDIFAQCNGRPGISQLRRYFDEDATREDIDEACGDVQVVPGGGVSCPYDYNHQLMSCSTRLQDVQAMMDEIGLVGTCRNLRVGVPCIERIMALCPDTPEVQTLSGGFNVTAARLVLTHACSNIADAGSACPYIRPDIRIQQCNRKLHGVVSHSSDKEAVCRIMGEGIACFQDVVDQCPDSHAVATFRLMVDMNDVRSSKNNYCSS